MFQGSRHHSVLGHRGGPVPHGLCGPGAVAPRPVAAAGPSLAAGTGLEVRCWCGHHSPSPGTECPRRPRFLRPQPPGRRRHRHRCQALGNALRRCACTPPHGSGRGSCPGRRGGDPPKAPQLTPAATRPPPCRTPAPRSGVRPPLAGGGRSKGASGILQPGACREPRGAEFWHLTARIAFHQGYPSLRRCARVAALTTIACAAATGRALGALRGLLRALQGRRPSGPAPAPAGVAAPVPPLGFGRRVSTFGCPPPRPAAQCGHALALRRGPAQPMRPLLGHFSRRLPPSAPGSEVASTSPPSRPSCCWLSGLAVRWAATSSRPGSGQVGPMLGRASALVPTRAYPEHPRATKSCFLKFRRVSYIKFLNLEPLRAGSFSAH